MNISGTTNTCSILANTQFVLSGLSQTNISTINVTDVPEGYFIWNIYVCDNASTPNCGFNNTNYTLTIDRTVPYFTAIGNVSVYDNESITYNINASDDISGINCFNVNNR